MKSRKYIQEDLNYVLAKCVEAYHEYPPEWITHKAKIKEQIERILKKLNIKESIDDVLSNGLKKES